VALSPNNTTTLYKNKSSVARCNRTESGHIQNVCVRKKMAGRSSE